MSHETNLKIYKELLGVEEKILDALSLSHGKKSTQWHRQRNRVETFRRQVEALEKAIEEEKKCPKA